jgi:hypothetical protein
MAIDADKLQEFLGRFIADLGATVAAGNVVIGHRLGLYQALAAGPRNWRPAPRPALATSPNGCAGRQRAGTSSTTRRPTPTQ